MRDFVISLFVAFLAAFFLLTTLSLHWDTDLSIVQYNPVNNQDWVVNHTFAWAHRYHGILASEWSYEKKEYGFWRDEKWCALFRSIK